MPAAASSIKTNSISMYITCTQTNIRILSTISIVNKKIRNLHQRHIILITWDPLPSGDVMLFVWIQWFKMHPNYLLTWVLFFSSLFSFFFLLLQCMFVFHLQCAQLGVWWTFPFKSGISVPLNRIHFYWTSEPKALKHLFAVYYVVKLWA